MHVFVCLAVNFARNLATVMQKTSPKEGDFSLMTYCRHSSCSDFALEGILVAQYFKEFQDVA